jgi:hypothetical protein
MSVAPGLVTIDTWGTPVAMPLSLFSSLVVPAPKGWTEQGP